jgi:hypothetical protein
MQLSGLKLHYVNWNRLINCGVKLMLLDQLFIYFQVDLIEYVGYLLVELSSWFFINTFKQRKSFVIGVSCLQVRVLCVLISVKSLFTKFIWTTEKLSDWWFKISGIRWYHWQFIVQNDSAKVESAINLFLSTKLIAWQRWGSQWMCIWLVRRLQCRVGWCTERWSEEVKQALK